MTRLFAALSLAATLPALADSADPPAVFPAPKRIVLGEGTARLSGASEVRAPEEARRLLEPLRKRLSAIPAEEGGKTAAVPMVLTNLPALPAGAPKGTREAYVLRVSPEEVRLEASGEEGWRAGLSTLLQLIPS